MLNDRFKYLLPGILLLAVLLLFVLLFFFTKEALHQLERPAYHIELSFEPAHVPKQTPVRLRFTLRDRSDKPLAGLRSAHGSMLHVVIASEDFATFAHLHPETFGSIAQQREESVFGVQYTFPKHSRYFALITFNRRGREVSQHFIITTQHTPIAPVVLVKDLRRVTTFDGYEVTFTNLDERIVAGKPMRFRYTIAKDGMPVTDLEPYDMAPMNIAAVSADLSAFIHAYGTVRDPAPLTPRAELAAAARFGPDVEAEIMFPYPGLYQIFGEFQHRENVVLTKFFLEVWPQVSDPQNPA